MVECGEISGEEAWEAEGNDGWDEESDEDAFETKGANHA